MSEIARVHWRMPSEWQPHAGTWLAWPHNQETWPHNLSEARSDFIKLTRVIADTDSHAYLCIGGDALANEFMTQFGLPNPRVILCDIPTNDAWARDYAPTFVVAQSSNSQASKPENVPPWFPSDPHQIGAVDWHYNAWGEKYPPFDLDQDVAKLIASEAKIERIPSNLCLEGGAIEINDSGVLLTTRSCVLNPNRNTEWSQQEVELELKRCLGAAHVIWLSGDAITGDDTDGHIDQLARFVNDKTIVYAWTDDRHDPQFPKLNQNLVDLKTSLGSIGLDYELIPLHLPKNPVTYRDHRLPASYCNFYITNEAVIVPQFEDPHDDRAVQILNDIFPSRSVIGLPSVHLSVGLGSFHCLTQQMPLPSKETR